MADDKYPWDLHPALTAERLVTVSRLLWAARRDALGNAAWALGDDAWSIGCRAYAFAKNRITRLAERGAHNWLRVLDHSNNFIFLIEGVPVRFYRGPADEPTDRTLRQQEAEAQQLSLAFHGDEAAEGLLFRLAVETDERGQASRVVFLALRGEGGRVECAWSVPLQVERASPAVTPTVQLTLLQSEPPPAKPRRGRRAA
ncbi:hypothetical protein GXW71_08285 [Roseomonas hellenica]|uniref:Uncharacterized protein n=1 Tax=Plastoroseomonas hellenica TaxID=2687306 RepID=A0ABS5EVN0_9PROT|nr:hypothetical protein [Plastoroseomonas hellenica]MBR0664352.1 hypothetical protein [Plastoroseomonas hellenica]